jgi:hypothetical protein
VLQVTEFIANHNWRASHLNLNGRLELFKSKQQEEAII